MTAYYEIVGYLPNGGAIQKLGGKAFDYGFEPPKSVEEYKYGENFGVQIYRLTYTNPEDVYMSLVLVKYNNGVPKKA